MDKSESVFWERKKSYFGKKVKGGGFQETYNVRTLSRRSLEKQSRVRQCFKSLEAERI